MVATKGFVEPIMNLIALPIAKIKEGGKEINEREEKLSYLQWWLKKPRKRSPIYDLKLTNEIPDQQDDTNTIVWDS